MSLNGGFTRRELLAGAAAVGAPAGGERRPNVLFILADQWRRQTLPSSGDPDLIAPNLKRLAAEGVHFDRSYVTYPLCCPARSSIVTGRFPQAYGMVNNAPILPLGEKTMAQELKKAGYATGYIGKWHLDGNPGPNFVPPGERRPGFDWWRAFSRGHRYWDSVYYRDTDEPIRMGGFEPDYQTDLAIEFIQQNRDRPFYLYLSWGPPHEMAKPGNPRGSPPEWMQRYPPEGLHLRPNVPKEFEDKARADWADYYGVCSALDADLGRLLAALDGARLAEDTIVVFASDHGDMLYSHGQRNKGRVFEESVAVPLLVRYPRRIQGNRKTDVMVSSVDYMPTLLTLCGAPIPANVHGRDLSRLLVSGQGERPDSVLSVCNLGSPGEWRMVIRGTDKLAVDVVRTPTHLYDLAADPYEMRNLVNDPDFAPRKRELLELLNSWIRRVG